MGFGTALPEDGVCENFEDHRWHKLISIGTDKCRSRVNVNWKHSVLLSVTLLFIPSMIISA